MMVLGSVLGLAVESALLSFLGSHWDAVRLIASTGLVVPIVAFLAYPETSGRSLEEIAPEPVEQEDGSMRAPRPATVRGAG